MALDPGSLRITPQQVSAMVSRLGRHGEQPTGGIIRPQYSVAWVSARDEVAGMMREAGLIVNVDAVGNLFGRLPGLSNNRTVLTGSHLDTVQLGGKYDGALGILAGIAALAALKEECGSPALNLEVVAFCEEEASRFHGNYFGTRAILGLVAPDEPQRLCDANGVLMSDAMLAVGLDPSSIGQARRTDVDAFIELHIEQGRILADSATAIGIVTAITGVVWRVFRVVGRADHAGTTPMRMRKDALRCAARIALAAADIAEAAGDPAVATAGQWRVHPGGPNIVPELVEFSLDVRHPDGLALHELVSQIDAEAESSARRYGTVVQAATVKNHPPAPMHAGLQEVLDAAARTCEATSQPIASGAGHDSQLWAQHVPTAMLFVPSIEGRSHVSAEFTTPEDGALGARVLAHALHRLAY